MQYSLWKLKYLNILLVTTRWHIFHLVPPHDLQKPFFFSRGATLALARMSLKILALINPIIVTFSKTFSCSLSDASSKCISDSTVLSSENTGKLFSEYNN